MAYSIDPPFSPCQRVAGKRRAAKLGIVDPVNQPATATKGHTASAMPDDVFLLQKLVEVSGCVDGRVVREGGGREGRMGLCGRLCDFAHTQ